MLQMRSVILTAPLIAPALAHADRDSESPEARLAAAGYTLPDPPKPVATYVTSMRSAKRFVRILGMVQTTEEFRDHPKVMNGFSDLMVVAFGDNGRGARSAVGMQSLPSNIPVEIEATVELYDGP